MQRQMTTREAAAIALGFVMYDGRVMVDWFVVEAAGYYRERWTQTELKATIRVLETK